MDTSFLAIGAVLSQIQDRVYHTVEDNQSRRRSTKAVESLLTERDHPRGFSLPRLI
jgi:hypothetical protein